MCRSEVLKKVLKPQREQAWQSRRAADYSPSIPLDQISGFCEISAPVLDR
jgi:hypothetical protein